MSDGKEDTGRVSGKPGAGSVSGIHTVRLTFADSGSSNASLTWQTVMASLGAWIKADGTFQSAAGALKAAPAYAGAARFAFMVEDGKMANRTTGLLPALSAGTLDLHSTGVDSIAVSKAQLHLRGRATVNGTPAYAFEPRTLFACLPGGGIGGIRLRVWHIDPRANAEVIDDENTGTPDDGEGSAIDADALKGEET